jgi:DNA-binding LacI/PurR family transcriptional regulator/DNA-binding transcriptional regulator YhcF (GntR family)
LLFFLESTLNALSLPGLTLDSPFPRRGVAETLKDRLVRYLKESQQAPGSRFLTDAELMERSGLSRSTVRRALDDLQKEGWVRREVGRGTFVGPRADAFLRGSEDAAHESSAVGAKQSDQAAGSSALRIAVCVLWEDAVIPDWYSPLVLRGIDQEAGLGEASVELLGHSNDHPDRLYQRLKRSRPDVLICLAGSLAQTFVIRDAQRLEIPVICAGMSYRDLGVPSVFEDNAQGMSLAYEHLRSMGHERIGLLLNMSRFPFVFDRLAAFRDCCESFGTFDSGSVYWINADGRSADVTAEADRLPGYLESYRPTAVISGSAIAERTLGMAARRQGISIPDELSVVAIDQSPDASAWLGVARPTTIAIPLDEMGHELVRLAQAVHIGQTQLPSAVKCRLIPGDSVADLRQA